MTDKDSLVPARRKRSRRTFTRAFKARLVALATSGETSVAQVAMDYKVNANLLRRWMNQANCSGIASELVPVHVGPQVPVSTSTGALEVALPHATLRFHSPWDPRAVAALLKALQ